MKKFLVRGVGVAVGVALLAGCLTFALLFGAQEKSSEVGTARRSTCQQPLACATGSSSELNPGSAARSIANGLLAEHWIDFGDVRVRETESVPSQWWKVFGDPLLDKVVADACGRLHSLSQARLQPSLAEVRAGGVLRRFRCASTSVDDQSQAALDDYNEALVNLQADVVSNYVQLRTVQERIELARSNVKLQRAVLKIVEARFKAARVSNLDTLELRSVLAQTEAQIPQLEIVLRQANNRLCILLA